MSAIRQHQSPPHFAPFVLVVIAAPFNCRSLHHSLLAIEFLTHVWAIPASLAMVAAQILFTDAPVMNQLFHTAPIDIGAWLRIVAVAVVAFPRWSWKDGSDPGGQRGEHAMPE